MNAHPSYLELDRFALDGRNVATAAHTASCPRCRAHLDRLGRPVAIPSWIQLVEQRDEPRWPAWLRLPRLAAVAAAGALTAAALVIAGPRTRPAAYDGVKGNPSVALYVRHEGRVALWDGHASVETGDGLRLEVSSQGFSHVAVATIDGAEVTELYDGQLSDGETLLPASWTVDESVGTERLVVVFSRRPVSSADLRAAVRAQSRTAEIWTTTLELAKRGAKR
jgi:hypothetical protein